MANTGARLKPEAIREAAFGSITANYVQMGPVFQGPIRIVRMVNDSDADVYFTVDNTMNQFRVKAGSFLLLDCKTNDAFFNAGQAIYQKAVSTLPTTGLIYVEASFT